MKFPRQAITIAALTIAIVVMIAATGRTSEPRRPLFPRAAANRTNAQTRVLQAQSGFRVAQFQNQALGCVGGHVRQQVLVAPQAVHTHQTRRALVVSQVASPAVQVQVINQLGAAAIRSHALQLQAARAPIAVLQHRQAFAVAQPFVRQQAVVVQGGNCAAFFGH